jgi:hypothetical protein
MLRTPSRQRFALGFALLLAAAMVIFTLNLSAQSYNSGSEVNILSTAGRARCDRNGLDVPRVYQGTDFGVVLRQYWDNEQVFLSIVFPDGRIFSAASAEQLAAIGAPPANFPWQATASNGGDYYATLNAPLAWPYGCYEVTAWGQSSNRLASGFFDLRANPPGAINPGRPNVTSLRVEDTTTGDPSGLHGSQALILGRGFRPQEFVNISITFPNGSVLGYPAQFTSDVGSFASSFDFSSIFPTGTYYFTAQGQLSGYEQTASFNLSARSSSPSGWAQLLVLWRYRQGQLQATQDERFDISGQFFGQYEQVSVWVTLPDNSVRSLPLQITNEYGEFFATVQLDGRLPQGVYRFTAQGLASGRLVISPDVLVVTRGDPVVDQASAPIPTPAAPGSPVVNDLIPLGPPTVIENNGNQSGTTGGSSGEQPGIYDTVPPEGQPDNQAPQPPRGPTF